MIRFLAGFGGINIHYAATLRYLGGVDHLGKCHHDLIGTMIIKGKHPKFQARENYNLLRTISLGSNTWRISQLGG